MPNWCNNSLTLSHSDPKKMQIVIDAIKNEKFFETIKPIPPELRDTIAGSYGAGTPAQIELEAQKQACRDQYGYSDWYEFCTYQWGTKWEASDLQIITETQPEWVGSELVDASVTVTFDTAWSSPQGIYEELIEQGYRIDAKYYEPGCGFAGWFTDDGGDSYFEWESLEHARDILPAELDEEFNIIENLEMWAEDQDEENE